MKPTRKPLGVIHSIIEIIPIGAAIIRRYFPNEPHQLVQVALAWSGLRLRLWPRQRRQQHRCQNRNDRKNDQQLDQSKPCFPPGLFAMYHKSLHKAIIEGFLLSF